MSELGAIVEVLLGAALLAAVVGILTLLILLVRARMLPRGDVTLKINQRSGTTVKAGGKLHEALASLGILVPTACGGKGTCGQCRVRVLEGGGQLLPTEDALINRREARAGMRLACQVMVVEDLVLRLPEGLAASRQWQCTVRSNVNVATFIRELVLELPAGEKIDFRAGSYVLVECPPYSLEFGELEILPPYRTDWERLGLFGLRSFNPVTVRRAYSMANCPQEDDRVMLNVRIATPPPTARGGVPPGVVSSWLFQLKPGDRVRVSGPFGEFFNRDPEKEMVYVGGGAGMAPMRSHLLDLLGRRQCRRRISFWYGARSLREAFYVEEFEELARTHHNFTFHLALSAPLAEDRWTGATGFIHDVLLKRYLSDHTAPEDCDYYICGPPAMIAAVNHMLFDLGVEEESIMFDDFGG